MTIAAYIIVITTVALFLFVVTQKGRSSRDYTIAAVIWLVHLFAAAYLALKVLFG